MPIPDIVIAAAEQLKTDGNRELADRLLANAVTQTKVPTERETYIMLGRLYDVLTRMESYALRGISAEEREASAATFISKFFSGSNTEVLLKILGTLAGTGGSGYAVYEAIKASNF